jgi:hypothetical protein
MEIIKILPRTKKATYEFYTENHEGVETVHGTKNLLNPEKCKLYLNIQKSIDWYKIREYGFRKI